MGRGQDEIPMTPWQSDNISAVFQIGVPVKCSFQVFSPKSSFLFVVMTQLDFLFGYRRNIVQYIF